MESGDRPSRDELKRRLKAAREARRSTPHQPNPPNTPVDLQSMLLSAGLDDAQLIRMAGGLGRNPRAMRDQLNNLVTTLSQAASNAPASQNEADGANDNDDDDGDEELPPSSS